MRKKLVENRVAVLDWEQYAWLRHGFTTRHGGGTRVYGAEGERNLGLTGEDDPAVVDQNRSELALQFGGSEFALATVRQVHGVEILDVSAGGRAGQADGLMTRTPGVLLGVMTADCVPVLLVDVRQRLVGAFHAGWRGTAAGMAAVAAGRMNAAGSRREDLRAAVGPSIGPCCYVVGDEVKTAYQQRGRAEGLFTPDESAGERLNLWEANRRQLLEAGLAPDRIAVVGECTACAVVPGAGRKYFSHRADQGRTGRMMAVIGVAEAG